jgi:hypothetical protein
VERYAIAMILLAICVRSTLVLRMGPYHFFGTQVQIVWIIVAVVVTGRIAVDNAISNHESVLD